MKNPFNIYEHETDPRPTIWRMAQTTGISQPAIWSWFNDGSTPRAVNLTILANFMKCTPEEALRAVRRCHYLKSKGYTFPFGMILHKDMFLEQYNDEIEKEQEKDKEKEKENVQDIGQSAMSSKNNER